MFELTSPSTVVVVRHETSDLVCTGARNVSTLAEVACETVARETGWDTPRTFHFNGASLPLQCAPTHFTYGVSPQGVALSSLGAPFDSCFTHLAT